MIRIENLTKTYNKNNVLTDINLFLPSKGFILLHGDSGSGKTTLLNCIGGIDRQYKGRIYVKNCAISKLDENKMREFRLNHIGYVFQDFNLLNLATVFQNVKMPLDAISLQKECNKIRRVKDALSTLGISHLANKIVNKLSGGEKQRVAIARAIINSPEVLLCDEPTGALDEKNSQLIYEILKTLSKRKLVIVASHDDKAFEYADEIIHVKDGRIKKSNNNLVEKTKETSPIFGERFKRKKSSLPLSFKFSHAFQKIKAKKFRSIITYSILSLSLTGIGVSLLLSFSVSNKITSAFASLTNGNQIVMSLNNANPNTYNNVYSAPEEKVKKLYRKYESYFEGYGVTYLVNFEDFFKDKNDIYVPIRGQKYSIASLSTRSINDYRLIDKNDNQPVYPYLVETLNDDEIILGLNYVDMVNLCYSLQIQRNYSTLGNYLRENELNIVLEVENSSWQYDDEQLFNVKGIREVNRTCFYHYNQQWNQSVFEKMMLLPSDDDNESYYPWEMYKIYYFRTIDDPAVFIDEAMEDEENYDFTFERTSYYYHPLLCKIGEICKEKRVLVYYADKNAIDISLVKKLSGLNKNLDSYYYISDYGYASYASNMLSGFSKNVFVSLSKKGIDDAIDMDTSLKSSDSNITYSLPSGVVNGNYMNGLSGGLKFSSRINNLVNGRLPKNNNEIVISNGLAQSLGYDGSNNELFFAGVTSETITNDVIEKEYMTSNVIIVGVSDEDKCYIYHNGHWTISFFRDKLGISMFNLTPKAIVFELDSRVDSESICEKLSKEFKTYTFCSPSVELAKSIDSTLDYANTILVVFSFIAIAISIILLGTIVTLNVYESKEEIKMFEYIGISKNDICLLFVSQSLLFGLASFVLSAIEIIAIDLGMSYVLTSLFYTDFTYSFSFIPFAIVFALSILICLITSFLVSKLLMRKKYSI